MEYEKQWPEQVLYRNGGDIYYHIKGFEPLFLKSACHHPTQSQALEQENRQPSGVGVGLWQISI